MKEQDEILEQVKKLNRESLKQIAEYYSTSGILDKTAIGLILTQIAYGFVAAEKRLEKNGNFSE